MRKRTKTLVQYINAHGAELAFKSGPGKSLTLEQCQEIIADLAAHIKDLQQVGTVVNG